MPFISTSSLYFPFPPTLVTQPLINLTYPPSTLSQTPVTILPNSTLHLPNPGTIRTHLPPTTTSLNTSPIIDTITYITDTGIKWKRNNVNWYVNVQTVKMGGCVVEVRVEDDVPDVMLER